MADVKADGYYFGIDGFFYGKEGTSTKVKLCTKVTQSKIKEEIFKKYEGISVTNIEFEDLIELAATLYGESSIGRKNTVIKERTIGTGISAKIEKYSVQENIKNSELQNEAKALACCIFNYKNKRNNDQTGGYNPIISKVITDMGAVAKGKANYNIFKEKLKKPELINGKIEQYYIEAGILAFIRDKKERGELKDINITVVDFSNGAILWDGVDLKTNYKNHPKVNVGYYISDEKHNVLDIQSKKTSEAIHVETAYKLSDNKYNEKRYWDYTYQTTAGIAKTMFVKLHPDYEWAKMHSDEKRLKKWWR